LGKAEPFFTLFSFLKYRIKAKGRHGTHSPFVYRLIEQCLLPAAQSKDQSIEQCRNQLRKQNQVIQVLDFKSGKLSPKKLSEIARNSLSRGKFSSFLSLFLKYLNAENVLETGTSLGLNAMYLAKPTNINEVITLEGNKEIAAVAKNTIEGFEQRAKIKITEGTLEDNFQQLLDNHSFDVIFLDADHRSGTIEELYTMIRAKQKKIKAIVIHDIYWSQDMKKCWDRLRVKHEIPITIDLFEAGILIFHIETPKQHFVLKF